MNLLFTKPRKLSNINTADDVLSSYQYLFYVHAVLHVVISVHGGKLFSVLLHIKQTS